MSTLRHLSKVRDYYDRMTDLYLRHLGTTIQAGQLALWHPNETELSNLYFAERAGIRSGQHLLDAGCGVCGPSIDIARQHDVLIDAITLSQVQARRADKLVGKAGLSERIRIHVGDYHQLPFADNVFDVVIFLESTTHAYDHVQLFRDVRRVLKPGGTVYIKDAFRKPGQLSEPEEADLASFNRDYAHRTVTLDEVVIAIKNSGFDEIRTCVLDKFLSVARFKAAMVSSSDEGEVVSELGRFHSVYSCLPIFFADINATKSPDN